MDTPIISNSSSKNVFGSALPQPSKWEGREVTQFLFNCLENEKFRQLVPHIIKVAVFILSTFFLWMATSYLNHLRVKAQNGTLPHNSSARGQIPALPTSDTTASAPSSSNPVGSHSIPSPRLLEQDCENLRRELEAIFSDLKRLHNGFGDQFVIKLSAFETKYGSSRGIDERLDKVFGQFDYIKSTYDYLKNLKAGLFIHESKMDNNNTLDIPSEGNCLFSALLTGLYHLEDQIRSRGKWKGWIIDHSTLRQECVNWMKQNYQTDHELQNYISDAIEASKKFGVKALIEQLDSWRYVAETTQGIDKENAKLRLKEVEKEIQSLRALNNETSYFALVEQNGFFASIAEIYAFSKIFEIPIKISRQHSGRIIQGYDPTVNPGFSEPSLHILHVNGNHFTLYFPSHS